MNLLINLDKPKGITSQEVVTVVKRAFHIKKAGHAGTLDPIATGVLIICLNEATKITRFLIDQDKEYIARIRLGESTDTLDSEGKVTKRVDSFYITREDIISILNRFQGEIEQTPPMYSAIKMKGKPLYKLARKGKIIERQKRLVKIHKIDLLNLDLPFVDIRVSCSKGTYIRSLCSDIGDALEVGGHITELRRLASGNFRVDDSITLDVLLEKKDELLNEFFPHTPFPITPYPIMTVDAALRDMDGVLLQEEDVKRAKRGMPIKLRCDSTSLRGYIKLKDAGGRLFGIGRAGGDLIKVERILYL